MGMVLISRWRVIVFILSIIYAVSAITNPNIALKLSLDPSSEPGLRPEPNAASIAP